jgi:hypothetical protein
VLSCTLQTVYRRRAVDVDSDLSLSNPLLDF